MLLAKYQNNFAIYSCMGELIDFSRVYKRRFGDFPETFYHQENNDTYGFTPGNIHMSLYLDDSIVYDTRPWRRVRYHIPEPVQGNAQQILTSLFDFYEHSICPRRDHTGKLIGHTIQLLGKYATWRGRPIIEGIIDTKGKVLHINYTRRDVVERENTPRTSWGALVMPRRNPEPFTLLPDGPQVT